MLPKLNWTYCFNSSTASGSEGKEKMNVLTQVQNVFVTLTQIKNVVVRKSSKATNVPCCHIRMVVRKKLMSSKLNPFWVDLFTGMYKWHFSKESTAEWKLPYATHPVKILLKHVVSRILIYLSIWDNRHYFKVLLNFHCMWNAW